MNLRQKVYLTIGMVTSLILVLGGLFIHWFIFIYLILPCIILIGGTIYKKYKITNPVKGEDKDEEMLDM